MPWLECLLTWWKRWAWSPLRGICCAKPAPVHQKLFMSFLKILYQFPFLVCLLIHSSIAQSSGCCPGFHSIPIGRIFCPQICFWEESIGFPRLLKRTTEQKWLRIFEWNPSYRSFPPNKQTNKHPTQKGFHNICNVCLLKTEEGQKREKAWWSHWKVCVIQGASQEKTSAASMKCSLNLRRSQVRLAPTFAMFYYSYSLP